MPEYQCVSKHPKRTRDAYSLTIWNAIVVSHLSCVSLGETRRWKQSIKLISSWTISIARFFPNLLPCVTSAPWTQIQSPDWEPFVSEERSCLAMWLHHLMVYWSFVSATVNGDAVHWFSRDRQVFARSGAKRVVWWCELRRWMVGQYVNKSLGVEGIEFFENDGFRTTASRRQVVEREWWFERKE